MMSKIVDKRREPERQAEKEAKLKAKKERKEERDNKRKEREQKLNELREKHGPDYDPNQKKPSKPKAFSEPPLIGLVARILRGVHLDIQKIHIRYEDDYFGKVRPFSFGFVINAIRFSNDEKEEQVQRAAQ
jgi:hypothetical protein